MTYIFNAECVIKVELNLILDCFVATAPRKDVKEYSVRCKSLSTLRKQNRKFNAVVVLFIPVSKPAERGGCEANKANANERTKSYVTERESAV